MYPDDRKFREGLPEVGRKEVGVVTGPVGYLEACYALVSP